MNNPLRQHWKPTLALLVLAPVLTELLSNNLPLSVFFHPFPFIFFSTIGYGFPILLIRELGLKRSYGLAQLAAIGVAYGILNEGILARTILKEENIPLDIFDHYGICFHIAVSWAFLICFWHAIHAVIYPVLTVNFFFPNHATESWIGRKTAISISVITAILALLIYFAHNPDAPDGTLPQLVIFVIVSVMLFWLAPRLPSAPTIVPGGSFQWKPLLYGFCFFNLVFFIPLIFARMQIPVFLFILYFIAIFAQTVRVLVRLRQINQTSLLLFMLGDQICLALFALLGAFMTLSPERLFASLIFLSIFAVSIMWLRRNSAPAPAL